MTPEIKNLMDARYILSRAYAETIGLGPAHATVWCAIEHLDKQLLPLIEAQSKEDAA